MVILILPIAFLLVGALWIMTGRSPFWWGAMAFIWAEAVRLQVIDDVGPACRIFVQRVRIRVGVVRQEIGTVV